MATVLVLGASSKTAQSFIALMAREYPTYDLKLFVRQPQKLTDEQRERYQVVVGDASRYEDYVTALSGVDYIYNSVGGNGTGQFAQLLLRAIAATHTPIKHVVDISAGAFTGSTSRDYYRTYRRFRKCTPSILRISGPNWVGTRIRA
ncbi:NAD(P)H-binding protein [Lactiplantibacillus carotarum]|uniref:NAD(P)H-binding protein n=1 Tax=Lactiplantibacillus carotarum TaxID=2993456 RepID=UPI00298F3B1B|nr:NAD(P)H-binding protein [Lactiplantibacillus carotarum]